MRIRPVDDADTESVLALNAESVWALAPLDEERLAWLRSMTRHALVCEVAGQVAGFALAFEPRTAYDSINYAWHAARFPDFLYLDRVAVSTTYRRRGVATALYDEMESQAASHDRMVCEVNSDPPNEASLAFHRARGYRELGRLVQLDGHEVVLMEKPL
ncbi:MAG TPA: GNAT family N-acetyltransferase [Nocardioidaceae bacterium]